ncbi:MAG: hypothetical protein H6837_01265 [Planctomycetes bacterium]|nr:hypothetical protein [Planctomycetota bacterium]
MQRNAPAAPDLDDTACRDATGKSLTQWFAALDETPGLAAGRRALVQHVYDAVGKDEWWATTIAVEYEKARGQREKDGLPKGYSICSTKTITAPLGTVFAAFGDAVALDAWLGGGTEVEFTDGGALRDVDGDYLTFTRIRKDKDLRARWDAEDLAHGSQLEVLFADKGRARPASRSTTPGSRRGATPMCCAPDGVLVWGH